jgi:beta-lactam-binding protein with PASTA domain
MPLGTRLKRTGRILLLAAGLLATYVIFLLSAMRWAVRARDVTVPDLRGKSISEATAALAPIGLTLQLDPLRRPDPAIPADHVLSQEPDAGSTTRRPRIVHVRMSDGNRAPVVPEVSGQSQRAAELELAQGQVAIGSTIDVSSDAYGADVVIAQDPPAHSRGSTITLLVNRAPSAETYVMPDLIGTTGATVATLLRSHNLRVTVSTASAYPGVPSGTVVRQTPQAGFQIAPGEPIALEVSR